MQCSTIDSTALVLKLTNKIDGGLLVIVYNTTDCRNKKRAKHHRKHMWYVSGIIIMIFFYFTEKKRRTILTTEKREPTIDAHMYAWNTKQKKRLTQNHHTQYTIYNSQRWLYRVLSCVSNVAWIRVLKARFLLTCEKFRNLLPNHLSTDKFICTNKFNVIDRVLAA